MRLAAVILAVAAVAVDESSVQCFSEVALAMLASDRNEIAPPRKCCGECGGTGLVRSGDKLEWVPCECPDGCECKKKSSCPDGKCPIKKK